jgi:hypothetical protein
MPATAYKDRISETSTFTGGGPVALLGPINGFAGFTRFNASQTGIPVMIETVDAANQPTGEWEVALCSLSADKRTLTRNTVRDSSNAGASVSFGAGTKRVTVVNDGMSIESKANLVGGNAFAGDQSVNGNVAVTGNVAVSGNTNSVGGVDQSKWLSEKTFRVDFSPLSASVNQKVKFFWPNPTRMQGRVEITAALGFEYVSAGGYVKKIIGGHLAENGTVYIQHASSEGAGYAPTALSISDLLWDAASSRWYVIVGGLPGVLMANVVHVTIKTHSSPNDSATWWNMAASKVVMDAPYSDAAVSLVPIPTGISVGGNITARSPAAVTPKLILQNTDGPAGNVRGAHISIRDAAGTEAYSIGCTSPSYDEFFIWSSLNDITMSVPTAKKIALKINNVPTLEIASTLVTVTGNHNVTGQASAANFYATGNVATRFQNGGAGVPVGASGIGLELYQAAGSGQLQCYDRTGLALAPLVIRASTVDIPGALTVSGVAVATVSQLANYLPLSGGRMTGPLDSGGYASVINNINNFTASVNPADPSHQFRMGYYNNGAEWGSAINSVVAGAGGPLHINPSGGLIYLDGAINSLLKSGQGQLNTGNVTNRWENAGSGAPAGSTGIGLEIVGNFGGAYSMLMSYNRTTSAYADIGIKAKNLDLVGAGLKLTGTNPVLTIDGDASSYYSALNFNTAYAAASYTISAYNGCSQNIKVGAYFWQYNGAQIASLDSNGSIWAKGNIECHGGAFNFGPAAGEPIADSIMVIRTTNYYPTLNFQTANGGPVGTPLINCGSFMAGAGGLTHLFDVHTFNNKANSVNFLTLNASGAAFAGPVTVGGTALATVTQLANYLPLTGGTLTGGLVVKATIQARSVTATDGYIGFMPGNAANSGYVEVFPPNGGARAAYFGYADAGSIYFVAEGGRGAIHTAANFIWKRASDSAVLANLDTNGIFSCPQLTGLNSNGSFAGGNIIQSIEARSVGTGGGAWMAFHSPSARAMHIGLDTDNVFKFGGWGWGYTKPALTISDVGNLKMAGDNFYMDNAGQCQIQMGVGGSHGFVYMSNANAGFYKPGGAHLYQEMAAGGALNASGPIKSEGKRCYRHNNAAFTSADIFIGSGAPTGGNDGDVWLQYV